MKYLTIDTTTGVTALALAEEERLAGEAYLNLAQPHSERLIPLLEQLLQSAGWRLEDLDFIGVVRGPGSFTGIRIGIATAQGLAQVLKIPVLGVSSLDVLSWAAWGRQEELIVLLDARKNEWYMAHYRWEIDEKGSWQRAVLDVPQALGTDLLVEKLSSSPGPFLLAGDGAVRAFPSLKERLGQRLQELPAFSALPRGAYAQQEVWHQKTSLGEIDEKSRVEPFYIRMSEAEINYRKKQEKNSGRSFGVCIN